MKFKELSKIDGGVDKRILRKKRFVSEEFRIFKNPKQVGKLHKK